MTELPSRKASEAEIEQFNDLAAPLFEYLQGLPDQAGMAVLCCEAVNCAEAMKDWRKENRP